MTNQIDVVGITFHRKYVEYYINQLMKAHNALNFFADYLDKKYGKEIIKLPDGNTMEYPGELRILLTPIIDLFKQVMN